MPSPTISFVVPVYNYGKYLSACLSSILNQCGHYEIDIIVVNDASTDDTLKILESFSDSRIQVVTHRHNQGHVISINEGFSLAKGKYIARIDPDDRYRLTFLETTVPILEKYPEVGMVYGNVALIDEEGTVTGESIVVDSDRKENHFVALLRENMIPAPTVIGRREAWQKALPIPTGLSFSDWYLSLQIARRYEIYAKANILADYRVHPKNLHTQVSRDKTEEVTVFRILNEIYSETEENPNLQLQKVRARRGVYGFQYVTLAEKYFWYSMSSEARRCYLAAFLNSPKLIFCDGFLRRFLATFMKQSLYAEFKKYCASLWNRGEAK